MIRMRRFLILASLTVLVLALIEVGARASVDGAARLPAFFRPGPEGQSYTLAPGLYRYWHRDRTVVVEIDADGRRRVPGAPSQAQRTLWLIGDSQVFGWGLDDTETIAARLQARLGLGVKVVNAGVPGHGPMAYVREFHSAPADALKLVVFTETNDGQDAYSAETFGRPHCGILISPDGIGSGMPCWFLRSHLFSTAIDLRNVLAPARLSPPLNCNPTVRSVGRVIETRIHATERVLDAAAGGRALTATVPWDARAAATRLDDYRPRLSRLACEWTFPDHLALAPALSRNGDGDGLFQRQDHHLSAQGADAAARHLAQVLKAMPDPWASAAPEPLSSTPAPAGPAPPPPRRPDR